MSVSTRIVVVPINSGYILHAFSSTTPRTLCCSLSCRTRVVFEHVFDTNFDPREPAHEGIPEGLDETEPGPFLGGFLSAIDVNEVSGYDRFIMLRAHQRMASHYQAHVYQDMAAVTNAAQEIFHRRSARTMYKRFFHAKFMPEHTYITDGLAAVEGQLVRTHIGEFGGVTAGGRKVDVPLSVFYTVKDRCVTEGRM